MFSALKKLFGRSDAPETTLIAPVAPVTVAQPPPTPAVPRGVAPRPAAPPVPPAPAPKAPSPGQRMAPPPAPLPGQRASGPADLAPAREMFARPPAGYKDKGVLVRVPYGDVASALPKELSQQVAPGSAGYFDLPLAGLLPQLASGAVRILFSELNATASPGLFTAPPAEGDIEIQLPLSAIVPRIDPAKLPRRAPVKRLDAPAEVQNLFGPKGAPLKPAAPFFQAPAAPTPSPTAVAEPKAAAARDAVPETRPVSLAAPSPESPGAGEAQGDVMELAVAQLTPFWPAAIGEEVRQLGLAQRPIRLPASRIEPALRTGRVSFTWAEVASWIQPEPAVSPANAATLLDLPLKLIAPLFVARFRARETQKKVQVGEDIPDVFGNKAATVPTPAAAAIPAAAPIPAVAPMPVPVVSVPVPAEAGPPVVDERASEPEPPSSAPVEHLPPPPQEPIRMSSVALPQPPAPAAPVPAPAPVVVAAPEPVAMPAASRLGALFGQPHKADWSPSEIVQKVAAMPGLTGALITLPEGLPVAAQLPPSINADAFAGFVPQMFARLAQYTRELRFGEVSKLSMDVVGGHLTVFRTGRVYFAVIGEGATAPTAQLALVASELSKLNP